MGRTFGKFITKSVVVNQEGEIPPIGTIIFRTMCRIIAFEQFSMLLSERGWHDKLSNTYVISYDPWKENHDLKDLNQKIDEIGQ